MEKLTECGGSVQDMETEHGDARVGCRAIPVKCSERKRTEGPFYSYTASFAFFEALWEVFRAIKSLCSTEAATGRRGSMFREPWV